jgi:hypothetical protein
MKLYNKKDWVVSQLPLILYSAVVDAPSIVTV